MNIGPAEILVVLVVALVVLGPSRLPDAARSLGKAMSEFRRVSSGIQSEVRDAFADAPRYPKSSSTTGGSGAASTQSLEQQEVVVSKEPDPPPSA